MSAVIEETRKRAARLLAVALLAGACLAAGSPSSALGAEPAPALKLSVTAQPTNFVPGSVSEGFAPLYSLVATNVGSAPIEGPVVFTDTLPPQLTAVVAQVHDIDAPSVLLPCDISGQTITCEDDKSLKPGEDAKEALQPGEWVQVLLGVEVDKDAFGDALNLATVASGTDEVVQTTTTPISQELPFFGYLPGPAGLCVNATDAEGQPATQAGSHPYGITVDFGFPTARFPTVGGGGTGNLYNPGHPKDLRVTLPRGMVANPTAVTASCTEAQLEAESAERLTECPVASQVGVITVLTESANVSPEWSPLYKMVTPPGVAAELGVNGARAGVYVHLTGKVNSAGEYELASETRNVLAKPKNPVLAVQAQLWGNPSDESHDAMRSGAGCGTERFCPAERLDAPFLTMPSSCRDSLIASIGATSWEEPSREVSRSAAIEDPASAQATRTVSCNQLHFDPSLEAKATTNLSDSPTGLDVNIHVPQTNDMEALATANFKDVSLAFPAGVAINPAAANGLGACSSAQIGLTTAIGQVPIHFDEAPAACPDAAKIGTVEVVTPALDHPLPGAVYVAKPFDNPFNSLLATYIAIDDPQTGVVAKLAGRVVANPQSGQLSATFAESPELPIEDVKTHLFGGPRAVLKSPLACATHTTTGLLTPWSTPEGASAPVSGSFPTSVGAGGDACPASEAAAPNHPTFSAGTITPQAGAYSPFLLKLSREDGSQRLAGIEARLPKGLAAKLAGIPYCSEAQIAAAKAREAPNLGGLEQLSPSCPGASQLGTVNVGVGAGPLPFYAQGHVYLAGPYKGAPLSFVIISPALAGPFDLGAVVVRTALHVNEETAEVRAVSDPLPTILDGIPLDVRSVAVKVDRSNFTLNPTNCDPKSVLATATSPTGQSAPLSDRFQVGGCEALKFAPKLAISLKGGTKRTKHPSLRGVVTYPQKGAYANLARAQVTLPHSEFLDQAHIGTVCTRVQFAARQCPKASVYGFARAFSPLLDKPVEGPVYLRSSSHELPDLVLALHGQIDVAAVARIDTGKGGGIRTTFEAVPDAPLSKVVLEMQGGKKGLLVNSEDLCKKPQRAIADFSAQNGKTHNTKPLIANSCKAKKHKRSRG